MGPLDPFQGMITSVGHFRDELLVCYIAMRWCCGASSIAPAEPLTAEQLAEKKSEAEPPLTAEQLAEKKEEAELIAAQLAKPSYWDEAPQHQRMAM